MAETEIVRELARRVAALRRHVVRLSAAQPAHLGGSLSCAEIMAVLFFHWLRVKDGDLPRDRFFLSKGHGVHAFHACLAELGEIDAAEVPKSLQAGSRLAGHPSKKAPLVEFATGSLGHALSVGIGAALAAQLDGSQSRTVVLLGDGELQEGSVWEAALCAPRFGCERLLAIVDANGFQAANSVADVLPLEPLADKWRSFGWSVTEIDGHDIGAILGALDSVPTEGRPRAIIARTVKGKGVPGVEGTVRAHYIMLSEAEAEAALAALEDEPR